MTATSIAGVDGSDLLGLTAALVAVPSVSRGEGEIAGAVEARLRAAPGLAVERVDDNVVARTDREAQPGGRGRRVVLAGHLDTVPPAGDQGPERSLSRGVGRAERQAPRIDGDRVAGLGAADMKGGLAVMLRLAEQVAPSAPHDLTFVFYAAEELADEHNGLRHLFAERPALVSGDLAVLLEPTGGVVEAGCQGTLRVQAVFRGSRAHTARPWRGENAVHKAAAVLSRIAGFEAPTVEVDGLSYRESLQVVHVEGGVAGNVVPDECVVVVNRRFAPARTFDQAVEEVRAMLAGADEVAVLDGADAAPPNLSDPVVAGAVAALGGVVKPKLGWTDVARFAAHGIPALNFGPGDAELAHTPDEHVTRASLDACYDRLAAFLTEA